MELVLVRIQHHPQCCSHPPDRSLRRSDQDALTLPHNTAFTLVTYRCISLPQVNNKHSRVEVGTRLCKVPKGSRGRRRSCQLGKTVRSLVGKEAGHSVDSMVLLARMDSRYLRNIHSLASGEDIM